ncbi:MAG: type 2 isopentenyl-diphosphate Delta-isomerase [Aerococcaceae bacterium]|nr:type 2 isopentenyl-diphosphate Delta-isomerase [Aerococcaceae bacterium]
MTNRKDDHVNLALQQHQHLSHSDFDDIRFVHHSFSPIKMDDIQLSTQWANATHSLPFFINGMTGGSEYTRSFNAQLAEVARETGLSMASGSVSVAMKDISTSDSFTIIRKMNPNGFVLANLGAHHTLETAKKAVDLLQANALQIHLNVPQEVVMPEGDRDFTTWAQNIEQIVAKLGVPVIVKEVGFGMSRQTIQQLIDLGVQTIDVGGRGGTNFITIENSRRHHLDFQLLNGWGQSTAESLLEAYQCPATILASGGIRHYLDIVKSLALGAKSVGISGTFLHYLHHHGVQKTIELVQEWQASIAHVMLMLGCQTVDDLTKTDIVLGNGLTSWATARHLSVHTLAQRSKN